MLVLASSISLCPTRWRSLGTFPFPPLTVSPCACSNYFYKQFWQHSGPVFSLLPWVMLWSVIINSVLSEVQAYFPLRAFWSDALWGHIHTATVGPHQSLFCFRLANVRGHLVWTKQANLSSLQNNGLWFAWKWILWQFQEKCEARWTF